MVFLLLRIGPDASLPGFDQGGETCASPSDRSPKEENAPKGRAPHFKGYQYSRHPVAKLVSHHTHLGSRMFIRTASKSIHAFTIPCDRFLRHPRSPRADSRWPATVPLRLSLAFRNDPREDLLEYPSIPPQQHPWDFGTFNWLSAVARREPATETSSLLRLFPSLSHKITYPSIYSHPHA